MSRLVKQYRESGIISGKMLADILDKLDCLEIAEEEKRLAIFPYSEDDDVEFTIDGHEYYIACNDASVWLSRSDKSPSGMQLAIDDFATIVKEKRRNINE